MCLDPSTSAAGTGISKQGMLYRLAVEVDRAYNSERNDEKFLPDEITRSQ